MGLCRVWVVCVFIAGLHTAVQAQPGPSGGGFICDNSCPLSQQDERHCCQRASVQSLTPATIIGHTAPHCTDEATCAPACDLGDDASCKTLRTKRVAACDGGDVRACFTASALLWQGIGGVRDAKKSGELVEKACEGEIADACVQQATRVGLGVGVSADVDKGKQLWAKAMSIMEKQCKDRGDGDSCARAAMILAFGTMWPGGVSVLAPDPARSSDLARRGCDLGDPIACIQVARGVLFPPSPTPTGPAPAPQGELFRAAGLAATACREATVRFTCQEALMIASVANDRTRMAAIAKDFLKLARLDCDRGDPLACFGAANVHLTGQGVDVDSRLAKQLAAKGLTALAATCKNNWDRCLGTVPMVLGQVSVDRTQLTTQLANLVRPACARKVWQACALGMSANLTTVDTLGDVLVARCKDKDARACIELSMQLPGRLGELREALGKRCDQDNDADACYARAVEATGPLPIPDQPIPTMPSDLAAWHTKACKNNAVGCFMPPPPAVMLGGRFF